MEWFESASNHTKLTAHEPKYSRSLSKGGSTKFIEMNLPTSTSATPGNPPPAGLGGWNLYFLVKLALFWRELIGFHPLENLAFALVLLVPLKSPAWRRARLALSIPAGIALLYYDSWLPPIGRALSQANLISSFSPAYLIELGGRFVAAPVVAQLVIVIAAYLILARWLRFSVLVTGALVVLAVGGIAPKPSPAPAATGGVPAVAAKSDPDTLLREFFAREAGRSVALPKPAAGDAPFDVIFLHVCSLSWDDLRAMGLENHPLWRRFDFLLTRFNSAATYSGPAAIRILRATCGQQPHDKLYESASANCYLMDGLREAGFEPAMVLNHDGHFDDFLKFAQAQRFIQAPMPLANVKVAQHSFDGSPIYDDAEVLRHWLAARAKAAPERMAVYYNTISLHDGNRVSGDKTLSNSLETYRARMAKLLDDLDGFLMSLEKSGRRAVVVVIPEHGAAVRGDKMQIAGLREIPSPAITLVPVGIKVVGPQARRDGNAARIDAPTSYLAVTELVARMLARTPFSAAGIRPAEYIAELPPTPFVAQNEDVVVIENGGGYLLKQGKEGWINYRLE